MNYVTDITNTFSATKLEKRLEKIVKLYGGKSISHLSVIFASNVTDTQLRPVRRSVALYNHLACTETL